MSWPVDPDELEALQRELAGLDPPRWSPDDGLCFGGCFVCFSRGGSGPGEAGDRGWAGAAAMDGRVVVASAEGEAGAPYVPGFLAAREGPLLEAAVRSLRRRPDVLLVNATGRDHPRRAGLALHLGWVLAVPTIGVTNRPLLAIGDEPGAAGGAHSPLRIGGEQAGWWIRSKTGARPIAVSPGWRTDLDACLEVTVQVARRSRTPEPIRVARRVAREARASAK